ncbi:hypothetical protein PRJ39_04625 [Lysobacter enzymogenes]|uniref:hypothetical protein n=1 Tax=Lysobacter enzymogenes TaxID=69 RepID=UPI003747E650
MSTIDPNELNPHRITDEQLAALRAADPDAFEDARADEPGGGQAVPGALIAEVADVETPFAAAPSARGAVPMIPKPRLDEVLNRVSELERQLRDRDARDAAVGSAPQARDFAAERGQIKGQWDAETAALKKQWDDGDLDADEYHDQRDALTVKYGELGNALTVEEARHVVATERIASRQQAVQEAAQTRWNEKIAGWIAANEAFMANPIRKKAVADLLIALDTEGDNALDDDALIALMQDQAFEAFGWAAGSARAPVPPADPRTAVLRERQATAARAAAAASAAPPQIAGGAGAGNREAAVDLEQLKPGDFKRLPEATQRALLGEDVL